jgi:hypothetical protein
MTGGILKTMLLNSLYDDAAATAVDAPPSESPTPAESSGSAPLIVVGVALVLGIAAAKWIAWGSKR